MHKKKRVNENMEKVPTHQCQHNFIRKMDIQLYLIQECRRLNFNKKFNKIH